MRTTSPPPSLRNLSLSEQSPLQLDAASSSETAALQNFQPTQRFSTLRRVGMPLQPPRSTFVSAPMPDAPINTVEDHHKAWDAWANLSNMPEGELRAQTVRKLKRFLANPPESGYLSLVREKISTVPPLLPPLVKRLSLSSNAINQLPVDLPASLTSLDVSHNNLQQLPTALPNLLTDLQLSGNQLSCVAVLPPMLQYFNAPRNCLTTLPALPASLKFLGVTSNLLTALPALPEKLATWMPPITN